MTLILNILCWRFNIECFDCFVINVSEIAERYFDWLFGSSSPNNHCSARTNSLTQDSFEIFNKKIRSQ